MVIKSKSKNQKIYVLNNKLYPSFLKVVLNIRTHSTLRFTMVLRDPCSTILPSSIIILWAFWPRTLWLTIIVVLSLQFRLNYSILFLQVSCIAADKQSSIIRLIFKYQLDDTLCFCPPRSVILFLLKTGLCFFRNPMISSFHGAFSCDSSISGVFLTN
jgi:hypothetical protein